MGQGSSAMSAAGAAGESEALLPAKDKQEGVAKETQTGGAEAYKTAIQDVLAMLGLGHFRISVLAVMTAAAYTGVAMSWSTEFVYVSEYYLTLGMSLGATGIAWTAPSTGIIILLPFAGALSDASTSPLGRRRPLILAGLVMAVVGLALFPFTDTVGLWLGDTSTSHHIAMGLAIACVTVGEVGLDLVMVMQRALMTDVLPSEELAQGNTVLAMANAIGQLLGYGLGSRNYMTILPFLGTNARACFLLAATVLAISGSITMAVPETPRYRTASADDQDALEAPPPVCVAVSGGLTRMWGAALRFPPSCAALFVVQFLNYCGWIMIWYYGSDWFGLNIFGGSSSDSGDDDAYALFEAGVELASLGFFFMALVNISGSFFISDLLVRLGPRVVWVSSQMVSAILVWCLTLIPEGGKHTAVAVFALLGLPMLVTYQLPWTLVSHAVQGSPDAGLYCTIFRYCEILPFIVIGYVSGTYIEVVRDNLDALFYGGGAIWAFAGLLAMFLVPRDMPIALEGAAGVH